MITEIRIGRGRIEVRSPGAMEWRQAGPLLALRDGDEIRVTDDASVVILLRGRGGSVRVAAANSPFVVRETQFEKGKIQKIAVLIGKVIDFLGIGATQEPKEMPSAPMGARFVGVPSSPKYPPAAATITGGPQPPVILTPRYSLVLPGPLTFEWSGSPFAQHTIRIVTWNGVVLEKSDLTGNRFDYPPDAPPLVPGTLYTLMLSSVHPPQAVWFKVLGATEAHEIRQDLTELERELGPTASPNTLALLRAGFLASNGLIHDARLSLIAATSKHPEEASFHCALGRLYSQVWLPDQAAESFEKARLVQNSFGRSPRSEN